LLILRGANGYSNGQEQANEAQTEQEQSNEALIGQEQAHEADQQIRYYRYN